jgi:hypothetical protein
MLRKTLPSGGGQEGRPAAPPQPSHGGHVLSVPDARAEAFVKRRQEVGDDTVVCIIEAMKVMNEIKAEKGDHPQDPGRERRPRSSSASPVQGRAA